MEASETATASTKSPNSSDSLLTDEEPYSTTTSSRDL